MVCFCIISFAFVTLIAVTAIYILNRWYRRAFISDFNKKYVFITGADSGFGYQLAVELDRLGLHVYAGCYTEKGANILRKESSSKLKTIPLDVTDQSSIDQAKSFIENDLPIGENLWGLVNNAGILGNVSFDLAILEDYHQVMEVNYFGSIRVTETFEQLIKISKGRIVQMSSMVGRGCMGTAPYTCSKFAIEPYADELRRYMRRFNVKVCTIEPSAFNQTSIIQNAQWQELMRQRFKELPDWKKSQFKDNFVEREIINFDLSMKNFPLLKHNAITMVTEAIAHGLGAKHPKARYLVGHGARFYVLLAGYTPDWFLDFIMRIAYTKLNSSH